MKKCRVCKKNKPVNQFHKNRHSKKDGLEWFCKECAIQMVANWRKSNPEKAKAINDRHKYKLRLEVIKEYGGKCDCCGEKEIKFLGIDHIDGMGNEEKRQLKRSGSNFYAHLRKIGYPKGKYQVLCHNCNLAKGFYGQCPHKLKINN